MRCTRGGLVIRAVDCCKRLEWINWVGEAGIITSAKDSASYTYLCMIHVIANVFRPWRLRDETASGIRMVL